MTPDQYELVAKHVHDIRYAERGRAVDPRVTDEDREFALAMCDDLNTAGVLADDEDHALCVTAIQYEAMAAVARHLWDGYRPIDDEHGGGWYWFHDGGLRNLPMTDAERLALDHIEARP